MRGTEPDVRDSLSLTRTSIRCYLTPMPRRKKKSDRESEPPLRAGSAKDESRRRCNQAKPCNNCSRRYPPVACIYESIRKAAKYKENVVDLNPEIKLEHPNPSYPGRIGADFLAVVRAPSGSRSTTPLSSSLVFLQPPSRHPSRGSWNSSPGSHEEILPPDKSKIDYGSDRDLSTAFRLGLYYPYPEAYQSPYQSADEDVPAGGVDLEPLKYLPIEPSKRHAQLFHFFMLRLSPYISSIDGSDPPALFNDQWIPFVTHSPIAIHITILTASYFQASTRGIPFDRAMEVIATKVKLIGLINEHIASHGKCVSDDAISAVMSLTYNELIYADERSTLAHMRGLREMIKTRGGLSNIAFPLLRMMLFRTDFQVACTYECDLFLHPDVPVPTLQTYPVMLDSPLLLSPYNFASSISVHNISSACAQILDDIRFLTTSVTNLSTSPDPADSHAKALATARWIHSRLTAPPDPNLATDYIYQTIHTTALIYASAILTRTPLSQSCTPELLRQLWSSLWRVPLPRWKQLPGVFFWVLLVASPYARDKAEGRFVKGLMPATSIGIGIMDWDVLFGIVMAFLGVQKWLGGELRASGKHVVGPSRSVPGVPEGGMPDWSLNE